MIETLGMLVTTDRHLGYVLGLTDAALTRKKKIEIFFSGKGVLLTRHPDFEKLVGKARLSVCDISFRSLGLSEPVPGVGFNDFVTQTRNAEMIEKCDRYIVL